MGRKMAARGFCGAGAVFGWCFLLYKDPVHESRLFYTVQKLPYFMDNGEAYDDFKQMLFNETTEDSDNKCNE